MFFNRFVFKVFAIITIILSALYPTVAFALGFWDDRPPSPPKPNAIEIAILVVLAVVLVIIVLIVVIREKRDRQRSMHSTSEQEMQSTQTLQDSPGLRISLPVQSDQSDEEHK